ncbi:UNVERIFIED_CONTAM: hypothetical protein FKN15_042039 [Acipenser sinensis]
MTYDDVTHLSAKIKPKQQKVEVEMAIDSMSPNYCRSKGEQIALNVDGTTTEESNTYSTKLMDKQTFSSIQATTNTSRYAAAVFRKGGDSSPDEAEEDVKQITVRFSRPESEQARLRRVQSYEFLQKKHAEEPWVHLHYYGLKDSRSEHERQYLFCQFTDMAENTELVKSPRKLMDKQTFSSIQATTNTSRYAAAVFRKGELHLTPLHGILQLRPSFSYLDKADSKHREHEAANEGGDSSPDEAEEDVKQITVRFSRPESEQARQRRVQSYEFLQKKHAEEPWVHLHYYGLKVRFSRPESEQARLRRVQSYEFLQKKHAEEPWVHLHYYGLKVRFSRPESEQARQRRVQSYEFLQKKHAEEPWVHLHYYGLKCKASVSQQCAFHGSAQEFATRGPSEDSHEERDVLYPKDSCSPHSGVPAEVLCRGRDYVMWKFTQERWVERKAVAAVVKLPPEDVKDFMEQMSVTRINRGWEFLLPHDGEFIKKHPDVAQRQHMLWMGIQAKLEKVFKLSKEDMMPKKQTPQPGSVVVSGEQLVTMAREKVRDNYSVLERELQQRHRAQSRDSGVVRVKQEPLSDGEEPMDTSSFAGHNGAVNGLHADDSSWNSVNGHCPPRAHTAPTQELRDFVSSIFRKHFVLTLSELKRLFNLHLASLPPGHSLFSGISDRLLQETVLDSKCKQILVPVMKVMPFANLMSYLSPGTDSTAVLRCIQQVAMLVQGNWVIKSDVLYPKDSCSPHSGVPAEVLCRGRDYVMWKFTQERWVERKAVAAVVKLPPEDVKDFMEQMSVTRINRGWEFLLPHDGEFIKKHPDVAQRQHMLWMGIQAKLEKVFKLSKEDMMPKKQTPQPGSVVVSGEQLVTMAREKVRDNYSVLERELQQRHRAQSRDSGVVRVKQEPLSDGEEPMDTSSFAGHNGAVNGLHSDDSSWNSVNGHCPPRAHTAPTQELRDFVSSIFRKHFVLTLSELKRLFNLHLASLPPGHSLFSGISDRLLQETVLDSKCKQILVPFPPQSSAAADEQKVFALWEMGDSFDQHRQILLEIFIKNYRVRRNLIQAKLTQEFGDNVTKTDLDRLLKSSSINADLQKLLECLFQSQRLEYKHWQQKPISISSSGQP